MALQIGAIAAPIIGGLLGELFGAGDRQLAEEAMKEAFAEIDKVGAPPDVAREILLEKFNQVGLYTPELEQAVDIGVSKVAQIQEAPELREAQMGALRMLQEQSKTGLTAEDRVALNQMRKQVSTDAEAKRAQIIQNMQARGIAGGGAELAAQLQQAQSGANLGSEEADRLAAMAQQRAREALSQGASLAGEVRGQEFDIERDKAQAADEFQRFGVQQSIARQERNIAEQNSADRLNLGEKQRISEKNIGQSNLEKQRQRTAESEAYQLALDRAKAKAAAQTAKAGFYGGKAEDIGKVWSGVGTGVGGVFSGLSKQATPSLEPSTDPYAELLEKEKDKLKFTQLPAKVGSSYKS